MADPWKRKPDNCFARRWYKIGRRRVLDRVFLVASLPLRAWTYQTPGVPFRVRLPHSRRVTLNDPARYERRVLSYDVLAAAEYAGIVATRTRLGRPICVEDAQIAAIARSGGLTLATRNTKDFSDIEELPLVNPWT